MVEKGFKQTEVGVIPEDWFITSIGDIATVVGGGTPNTFDSKCWNGYINWFTPTEVGYSKYLSESNRKITNEGLKKSSAKLLPKGTILLTTRASIGEVSILLNDATTNQGFQNLIANEDVDNEFLYYLVLTIKKYLIQNASGSTFLEISPSKLKSIKIPLPTKAEQTAIATVLNDADALIQKLEQLIAKKRNIKTAAMQELLKPKEGWVTDLVGNYLAFQVGYPFSSRHFNQKQKGIRLVKNRDLKSDDLIFHYDGVFEKQFLVQNGDVLISMDGEFISCLWNKGQALLNQRVGRLVAKMDVSILFMFYYLQKPLKEIENRTSSTTVKHLSHGDIEKIIIPIPNPREQTRIAQILSDMDNEIQELEKQLEKYKQLKQGMMQVLLTGKIRLVKP